MINKKTPKQMMNNEIYAFCPIISNYIDEDTCVMTVFAAEGILPAADCPEETTKVKGYEQYCSQCKFNKDL